MTEHPDTTLTPETLKLLVESQREAGLEAATVRIEDVDAHADAWAAREADLRERLAAAERVIGIARRMATLEPEVMRWVNFTELRNLWKELVAALAREEEPHA